MVVKLYEVFNGWTGNGEVSVLVIADEETDALMLAESVYRAEEEAHAREPYVRGEPRESYWTNLEASLLCDDTSQPWCGVPSD